VQRTVATPLRPRPTILTLGAGVVFIGVGMAVALLPEEATSFFFMLAFAGVLAAWFLPRMARKQPEVPLQLLAWALIAKLAGSLIRYVVLEVVYKEVGDAYGYHAAGLLNYESVRDLDFTFLEGSRLVGTDFVDALTSFVYALIGPSMLGAFVLFSLAAFAGAWMFYRAHRIAFPDGDGRLYFLLVFFFPTMLFWPSSLGKDALVILGTGMATYGLARLLRGMAGRGFPLLLLGVGITFVVRPAVGAVLLFGAVVGFLLHPGRAESPFTRPLALLILGPLLVVGMAFTISLASQLEGYELTTGGAASYYGETVKNVATGGSAFEPAVPTTPGAALQAAVTVLFRPFIGEGDSLLTYAAGLESLALLLLFLSRFPAALRALKRWRGGMIITAIVVTTGLVAALGAFSNFGLLVRQRAQVLTFLFLILTAAAARSTTRWRWPAPAPQGLAAKTLATDGKSRIRSTAPATLST
jgi:hypothetical protein